MADKKLTKPADKIAGIEFEAELRQVKSMADGTYNITLNVPEYCLEQAQVMLGWLNSLVKVVMVNEVKSE